jgi:hypothetical protein
MRSDARAKIIHRRTPASAAMLANVKRAMTITAALNRLTFNDADEIRALFSELIGRKVDEGFLLILHFIQPAATKSVSVVMSSSIRTVLSTTLAASTSQTM